MTAGDGVCSTSAAKWLRISKVEFPFNLKPLVDCAWAHDGHGRCTEARP